MAQQDSANSSAMAGDLVILLSDILNVPVLRSGKKIGLLTDLVIAETAKIPEVRSLYSLPVVRQPEPSHPVGECPHPHRERDRGHHQRPQAL